MERVGSYRITGRLGQGGMAAVYKGLQVSLDRPVAIKVLSRKLSDHAEARERFERESLIIARLNHPNIIHVIDRGVTPKGMPFFVMEYLEGTDLAAAIREGTLDFTRKLDLSIQVCKALSYAHKNGVVHRDVKPANVLIDAEGNARVLDFGIAQFYGGDGAEAERTQVGVVMGTVGYMSPEQQTDPARVTAASDLYSLGAMLYELFTGAKPVGRLRKPSELAREVPPALDELILRCLEPEPERRPTSADEIKDGLLKLLRGAHLGTAQRERAGQSVGRIEEKFALLDVIKEDRYGAVYLYEDRVDPKLLVLKRRSTASSGFTESKLLTTLKHRHIVNVLGASKNEKVFIVVMEYLSGGSLKDRLLRPLPLTEALSVLRQICEGLSFAHRNRIVHGNLRPSNVLFTGSGEAKVTDFGLDEHYENDEGVFNWYGVQGEPRSPRKDLFAAGVIGYQMLTGGLPSWRGSALAPSQVSQALPERVRELLLGMTSREPAERYPSVDSAIAAIEGIEDDARARRDEAAGLRDAPTLLASPIPPAPAPRRNKRALVLLGVLLGVAGYYLVESGAHAFYRDTLLALWTKVGPRLTALLGR